MRVYNLNSLYYIKRVGYLVMRILSKDETQVSINNVIMNHLCDMKV